MRRASGPVALVLVAALVASVVVAALAGGGGDGPDGTPDDSSTTATTSAAAGEAQELFDAALAPLVGVPVIDFTQDVYSGQVHATHTEGRAFQQAGWQATTSQRADGGGVEGGDLEGGGVEGRMDVRAVGEDLYLRLSSWKEPLAGCWLRTGRGQVPGGQLAMTPGVPGYITLLGALRPQVVVRRDADDTVIGADVPLRVGLQLLTTGVLGLLGLEAGQLDGSTVPLGVHLADGVLTGVELLGSDLVAAVRAAGGDLAPDAEATVAGLRIEVGYRPGPEAATPVTAPPAGQVMTNADVEAGRGC